MYNHQWVGNPGSLGKENDMTNSFEPGKRVKRSPYFVKKRSPEGHRLQSFHEIDQNIEIKFESPSKRVKPCGLVMDDELPSWTAPNSFIRLPDRFVNPRKQKETDITGFRPKVSPPSSDKYASAEQNIMRSRCADKDSSSKDSMKGAQRSISSNWFGEHTALNVRKEDIRFDELSGCTTTLRGTGYDGNKSMTDMVDFRRNDTTVSVTEMFSDPQTRKASSSKSYVKGAQVSLPLPSFRPHIDREYEEKKILSNGSLISCTAKDDRIVDGWKQNRTGAMNFKPNIESSSSNKRGPILPSLDSRAGKDCLNKNVGNYTQKPGLLPGRRPLSGLDVCEGEKTIFLGSLTSCNSKAHQESRNPLGRGVDNELDADELWTVKYKPKKLSDLVGNNVQIQRLKDWLLAWNSRHLHKKGHQKERKVGSGAPKVPDHMMKAVLLHGEPGLGKTSSATLICQQLGYNVMEVNASDSRSKSDREVKCGINGRLANVVRELVTNRRMVLNGGGGKLTALVMDEVDGMSGGDQGGIQELIQSIHSSKIPIVCICNDKYSPKLKSLVGHCMELGFAKPSAQQVSGRLQTIALSEGITIGKRDLELLSESSRGDIRLAINRLQFMARSKAPFNTDLVRHECGASVKDVGMSPFVATERLLLGAYRGQPLNEQLDLVFHNSDLVPLLVQENYINYRPLNVTCEISHLERVVKAADAISDGDLVNTYIQKSQNWNLMPFASIQSGVASATYVRGYRATLLQGERNYNRFPSWLGKNSKFTKCRHQLSEVQYHLLLSGNCRTSWGMARQDYYPVMARRLTEPLREREKEGVHEVLDLMAQHCLTKDDRDAILEMSTMQGMCDPQEGIFSQVKSTFTRLYNQQALKQRVKSSCMLPVPNTKKRRAMLENSSSKLCDNNILTGGELVDDLYEDVDEESQGQKEKEAICIPGVKEKEKKGREKHGGVTRRMTGQ